MVRSITVYDILSVKLTNLSVLHAQCLPKSVQQILTRIYLVTNSCLSSCCEPKLHQCLKVFCTMTNEQTLELANVILNMKINRCNTKHIYLREQCFLIVYETVQACLVLENSHIVLPLSYQMLIKKTYIIIFVLPNLILIGNLIF